MHLNCLSYLNADTNWTNLCVVYLKNWHCTLMWLHEILSDEKSSENDLMDVHGYLLNCMHKQQDFFGCLAEILGCLGLREAANLEI